VQQESGGGVFLIGIQTLSHRDEPNAVPFQVVNVVEAVDKRAPKPVQLPNQETVEFARCGDQHQPIQLRPVGLRPADHILIDAHDLPALPFCVFTEFSELKFRILFCSGNADVQVPPSKSLPHIAFPWGLAIERGEGKWGTASSTGLIMLSRSLVPLLSQKIGILEPLK
jgi:hypothetical protein